MERDPMTVEQFVTILWMGGIITAGICIWSTRTSWLPWFQYVGDLLAYWWQQEMIRAERKAQERATRKSQPLVAINVGNHYQDDMSSDDEETTGTDTGMRNQSVPDRYQVEPAGIATADTGTVLPDTTALVTHLAQIRLTTGAYAMSANRIVASVEMSRNDVLALVRQARNEPEPVSGPQFEQVGDKQQFKRVGVKPIR